MSLTRSHTSLRNRRLLYCAMALCYGLLSATALALPEDRELPITGKADSNSFDINTGISILTGNVVITQGNLEILADQVVIETDPETNELSYIKATGNPAIFTDIPQLGSDMVEVNGNQVEFFPATDIIITLGEARITQSGNEARGEQIEYQAATGQVTIQSARSLSGNQDDEQAELLLLPGSTE